MRKFKADSSVINTVFYENNNLIIKFNSGAYYKYKAVDESVFNAFEAADSQGIFFNKFIKPYYAYEKIDFVEPTEEQQPKATIDDIPVGEDFLKFLAAFAGGNFDLNETLNEVSTSNATADAKTIAIPTYATGKIKKITIIEFE